MADSKALEEALAQIEKQFGKGAVMKLGERPSVDIDSISTGALTLDIALGIGGLPRGRVVEIFGPESSGKTTLAQHVVAEAQKVGGLCAFIDAEHAMDPKYAADIGVNVDDLLISQPDTMEEGLEIVDTLLKSNALAVIVVDSVAALVPKAEIAGEMGDSHVGLHPRLMSQAMRKITGHINHSGTLVLFINQLREKIGVIYGSPEFTPGGRALKFYASVRLDIRRTGSLKVGDEILGNETRVKVVKNKVAPPFKQATFDIIYGKGIDQEGCLIDVATSMGIIEKTGSWHAFDGEKFANGRPNAKTYLVDHPELAKAIMDQVQLDLNASAS